MENKNILIIILLIVIIGIGFWIYQSQKEGNQTNTQIFNFDHKNCTYNIEGGDITLKDGYSEKEAASDSASKIITKYFGNETSGDFNGDRLSDVAFLLTQTSGGSGTFYYAVVALASNDKCNGTNAILLGDRIAPQTTNFQNGEIVVNYAERRPNEPMTETPSVGASKYFKIDNGKLVEIIK